MGLGADLGKAVFGHRTHVAKPLWHTGRFQAGRGSYGGQRKRCGVGGKRLADPWGVSRGQKEAKMAMRSPPWQKTWVRQWTAKDTFSRVSYAAARHTCFLWSEEDDGNEMDSCPLRLGFVPLLQPRERPSRVRQGHVYLWLNATNPARHQWRRKLWRHRPVRRGCQDHKPHVKEMR